MDERTFFEQLRRETAAVFQQAPVRRLQQDLGRTWSYSICATPIRRHSGIIFGLNWGGGGNTDLDPATGKVYAYAPQNEMPDGSDIHAYRFIKRTLPYLQAHLHIQDPVDFNYSNLCFFRTPSLAELNQEDWLLSLPLFEQYVHYIEPPWLLLLGTSGLHLLKNLDLLVNLAEHRTGHNGRVFCSYSGLLLEKPFIGVPHPQAHLPSPVRESLWAQACRTQAS